MSNGMMAALPAGGSVAQGPGSPGASSGEPSIEDREFKASDGTAQRYVLYRPPGAPAVPAGLLIALHGYTFDRWQCVRAPRDECRAMRDLAARHGLFMVSPDYRAPGSFMDSRAEEDLLQILADLRREFPGQPVIFTGGSMGGAGVLTFAVLHPELVQGVCSLNGVANLVEFRSSNQSAMQVLCQSYGGDSRTRPEEYRKRSAELHPERLRMPISFTTGGKDDSTPPDSVLRLAKLLQDRKAQVLLIHRPETGHETNYEDTTRALEFVTRKVLNKE